MQQQEVTDQILQSWKEHEQLLAALEKRDRDGCIAALKTHFTLRRRRLKEEEQ